MIGQWHTMPVGAGRSSTRSTPSAPASVRVVRDDAVRPNGTALTLNAA